MRKEIREVGEDQEEAEGKNSGVSIEKGFSKELEYKVIAGVRQKDK